MSHLSCFNFIILMISIEFNQYYFCNVKYIHIRVINVILFFLLIFLLYLLLLSSCFVISTLFTLLIINKLTWLSRGVILRRSLIVKII